MGVKLLASLLFAAILLAACGGGGIQPIEDIDPTLTAPVTTYLPFVEEAEVPTEIYAEEQYWMTFKLSSVNKPEILRGDLREQYFPVGFSIGEPGHAILLWLNPENLDPNAEPSELLRLPIGFPEPGVYTLRVHSAIDREQGGLPGDYILGPPITRTPDVDFITFTDYEITVLERP